MPDGDEVARGIELDPVTLFLRPIGMYVELVIGPPSSGIVDTWNRNRKFKSFVSHNEQSFAQGVKVFTLGRQNEKNSSYVRLAHTFGLCFMSVCLMKSNCYSLIYSSLTQTQKWTQSLTIN